MSTHDCGHSCCDERHDPMHDHFLAPDACPSCRYAVMWVVEFDYRSDNGERLVGPFPTKAEGQAWLARQTFDFEALVTSMCHPAISAGGTRIVDHT